MDSVDVTKLGTDLHIGVYARYQVGKVLNG
jgi:hypothetical protein